MNDFHLFFAPPSYGNQYRREQLDLSDKKRLQSNPGLETRASWRTSRALKQYCHEQFPGHALCLSHKHDHAVIALGTIKPGVDLERLRPRDHLALIERIGNRAEIMHIRQRPGSQQDFYRLWTLKESLIKAENLNFPTDMSAVGITHFAPHWALRGTKKQAYLWLSAQLNQNWLIAAVWPQTENHQARENRLIFYAPQYFPVVLQDIKTNLNGFHWRRSSLSRI